MDKAYDVNIIFADMEQELIAGYKRTMKKHSADEVKEGFKWEQWQSKKLKDLQEYKKEAAKVVTSHNNKAKKVAKDTITQDFEKGAKVTIVESSFGRVNNRKLDAIIKATNNDFNKASSAALRLVDDEIRQIIFSTEVAYSAGAITLEKAIDTAAKDFLSQGINCVQYKNGANVNIASYAEMALRTSNKKAYLTGEGLMQAEMGEYLTQVTSYGGCSPKCLPWQGRVYVNDVYAGGKSDGVHPLLSSAMDEGLFHPNCRHTCQPWFEGISTLPKLNKSVEEIQKTYAAEQKQRGIERKIREYKRISAGSLGEENQMAANEKVKQWQERMRQHLKENPFLSRKSAREKI